MDYNLLPHEVMQCYHTPNSATQNDVDYVSLCVLKSWQIESINAAYYRNDLWKS